MTTSDRDFIEAMDPSLVPVWHRFPIESYARILRSGSAAASSKRYDRREDADRDLAAVMKMLRYYADHYPDLGPSEFGQRRWQSAEDGRWRWAVMPEPVRPRVAQRGAGSAR